MENGYPNLSDKTVKLAELRVLRKAGDVYSIQVGIGDEANIQICEDRGEENCKVCRYERKCPISFFKKQSF